MRPQRIVTTILISAAILMLAAVTGACSIINPPPPATPTTSAPTPTLLVPTREPTTALSAPTPTLVNTPAPSPTITSPTLQPTASATAAPSPTTRVSASPSPITSALCTDFGVSVSKTLRVSVVKSEAAPFEDYVGKTKGTGCSLTAKGTGTNFQDPGKVANDLRTLFTGLGWKQDIAYDADGPTGTASGYRQNAALALVSVKWDPAPDANCPKDQPTSACALKPAQKLYTISVNIAQEGAAGPTPAASARRLQFPAGETTAAAAASLAANGQDRYLVPGTAGQFLMAAIALSQGDASLAVLLPDNKPLFGVPGALEISGTLTATQDYIIQVASLGKPVTYSLDVTLLPASASRPSFNDPFAYCSAIRTTDVPDAGILGPKVTDALALAMSKRLPDVPLDMLKKSSFRCVNGAVLACFVGANIPCSSKASTDRTPRPEMAEFCKAQPNANVIPAAVTGRETVYEWRCTNGQPATVRQVLQVDSRGYAIDFWQVLTP